MSDWINGHWIGFDLESSGLDTTTGLPVSYCFGLRRPENPPRISCEHHIVDPGIEIPPEVAEIHGITTERARAEGVNLVEALEHIVWRILWAAENDYPLVGMNVGFDLTMVDQAARRHLGQGLTERGWQGPVIDVLLLDRQIDRYRKGSRKLVDMAKVYGVDITNAHDAKADVVGALNVLAAMLRMEQFRYVRRWTTADMVPTQAKWRRSQMESFNEYRLARGEPALPPHEFHWPLYQWD